MIGDQTFKRTLNGVSYGEALYLRSLLQLVRIMVCHRADEMDGEVGTTVRHDITLEERAEIIDYQLTQQRIVEMLMDEQRHGG